jgi:hypothetical protein
MLGPINSELRRKNSEKEQIIFLQKVEEITKLYIDVNIPVPTEVQLKNAEEVAYCYNKIGKELPELTKKKLDFLNKIGYIKLSFTLVVFGLLITFLLTTEKVSLFYQLVISLFVVLGAIPLFMIILNGFIENWDKKLLIKKD